jgi:hypothetical protein
MRLPNDVRRTALAAGALFLAGALSAAAQPVFGPTPFVKTEPGPQVFTDTFTSPAAGRYALWVNNGDEAGRVSAGTIAVNGVVVASEADFRRPAEQFWKPVGLLAGRNTLTVQLKGDPGGYVTIVILPVNVRPDLVVGRLVLPWGSASPQLVLSLKNGSHAFPRFVKVGFYDAAGQLVAASERFALDPRASQSSPVEDLIATGAWKEGSIEIFYAGQDGSRLFATAALTDPTTAIPAVLVLPHAGVRHHADLLPAWTTRATR